MAIGHNLGFGLAAAASLAAPAQAECLSGCGYGTLVAIAVAIALAVLALGFFVMVKLGIAWLIKWIVVATILAVAIPPAVIGVWHGHKRRVLERLDHAGPLPKLADRTPLVILGGELSGCSGQLERYVEAQAGDGIYMVELWPVEDIDFSGPIPLARLPLVKYSRSMQAVSDSYIVDGEEISFTDERLTGKVDPLSPGGRQSAAAEIDYLVIAQCQDRSGFFDAFRDIPGLQTEADRFDVELALAPIEKGSGTVSVRDLTFDLLDLRYAGVTRGFLFAGARVGGGNTAPYDPAKLTEAFCARRDGSMTPDCD